MEYVMVPVPEECLDAVQRYLQWGLQGGVTETWDPEVVQAIWDEVDADIRSLLVVAAESNRAREPLTLADAAERLGVSHPPRDRHGRGGQRPAAPVRGSDVHPAAEAGDQQAARAKADSTASSSRSRRRAREVGGLARGGRVSEDEAQTTCTTGMASIIRARATHLIEPFLVRDGTCVARRCSAPRGGQIHQGTATWVALLPPRAASADHVCGHTDHRCSPGYVVDHDSVGADLGSGTNRDRAEDLGSGSDGSIGADRRSSDVPLLEADGDERPKLDTGVNLGEAVDHHLPVRNDDPRMHEDGIASASGLGPCDGQPVGDPRYDGDVASAGTRP